MNVETISGDFQYVKKKKNRGTLQTHALVLFHPIRFIVQLDFCQLQCSRESVISEEQYVLNKNNKREGPTSSFVLFADVSEGLAMVEEVFSL